MIDYLLSLLGVYPTFGGVARSGQWSAVRKAFLKGSPTCAVCGTKGSLLQPNEVHHEKPYHLHPELELNPSNLITLCRPHHLLVGHFMLWASWNIDVRKDAEIWLKRVQSRPVHNGVVAE